MNQTIPFKQRAIELLKTGAKEYSKFLGFDFILKSDNFINREKYILRFYEGNFLHLTGVKTSLDAKTFFEKCLQETITISDFDCDSTKELKGTVRHKLSHIITISSFFDGEIKCQESFVKGQVQCIIAATDKNYTLGFVGGNNSLNPNTLLHKDLLDPKTAIENIEIIKKRR